MPLVPGASAWLTKSGAPADWKKIIAVFTEAVSTKEIKPNAKARRVYDRLVQKYARCERDHLPSRD